MDKIKLYYQCCDKLPLWDFCADAWLGARYQDIPALPFERAEDVPNSPYNIIVGSVEESTKWLLKNGYDVPTEIDVTPTMDRRAYTMADFLETNTYWPRFIKPKGAIKSFTGTVVASKKDAEYATYPYNGEIWVYREVVEYTSEWRAYVHNGEIINISWYRGDPLFFPHRTFIKSSLNKCVGRLKQKSFTLDFGVMEAGNFQLNQLIEGNDAWAIGNYGLEPKAYFNFVKDRWLQMTGLIK